MVDEVLKSTKESLSPLRICVILVYPKLIYISYVSECLRLNILCYKIFGSNLSCGLKLILFQYLSEDFISMNSLQVQYFAKYLTIF